MTNLSPHLSYVEVGAHVECAEDRWNFRLEKLTGKAAKPPAAGGGGDKKLSADE